ncbi:MAG: hypothetical protein IKJ19_02125 [Clostridia bacterium]|nr:hypothetical protein [Clostridia bacterium]
MKKLTKLTALLLIVVSLLTVAACSSSYGKLKKAFEAEGYAEVQEMESITASMKEKLEQEADDKIAIEFHVMQKATGLINLSYVFVIEFNATEDLVEYIKGSETAQGFVKDVANDENVKAFYNSLVEAGYANGNCLVFSLTDSEEVKDIVRNA